MSAMLVVDASAVLEVLLEPGERGELAAWHMESTALVAPDLIGYEVLNVVRRQRAAGNLSEAEARWAVEAFRRMPIELWPLESVVERVWELSGAVSAYDAPYVAVAEAVDTPLLTRDRRLAAAPGVRAAFVVI